MSGYNCDPVNDPSENKLPSSIYGLWGLAGEEEVAGCDRAPADRRGGPSLLFGSPCPLSKLCSRARTLGRDEGEGGERVDGGRRSYILEEDRDLGLFMRYPEIGVLFCSGAGCVARRRHGRRRNFGEATYFRETGRVCTRHVTVAVNASRRPFLSRTV